MMWDFIVRFESLSSMQIACRLRGGRGRIFGYSSSPSLFPRAASLKGLPMVFRKGTHRFMNTIFCLCATAQKCKCKTQLWHKQLMQSVGSEPYFLEMACVELWRKFWRSSEGLSFKHLVHTLLFTSVSQYFSPPLCYYTHCPVKIFFPGSLKAFETIY